MKVTVLLQKKGGEDDQMSRFSKEELEFAKSVDLTVLAERLGYTVQRVGKYHTLKEMDSIRIYNRRSWYRWSREYEKGKNGGSQIDFLKVFAGMEVKEAVFWLLDFAGYRNMGSDQKPLNDQTPPKPEEEKEFILPKAANGNGNLYRYLISQRALSQRVVNHFVKKGLIYESAQYKNIVFLGKNKEGTIKFASLRGVLDQNKKGFRCDVAGSDKSYGFNDVNGDSTELVVTEAAIDVMSYMDIFNDFDSNKLALGMVFDAPLQTFLQEYPQITQIRFCLDNDKAGRKATDRWMEKYQEKGYAVMDCPPPQGYKDYNQWLQAAKQVMEMERYQAERTNREKFCTNLDDSKR